MSSAENSAIAFPPGSRVRDSVNDTSSFRVSNKTMILTPIPARIGLLLALIVEGLKAQVKFKKICHWADSYSLLCSTTL